MQRTEQFEFTVESYNTNPQSRAQQKTGGYRRVEVFLAVDAAIALRQLMRDGSSARDVIEALLLAERQRRKEHAGPSVGL